MKGVREVSFRGTVLVTLADTLAAHQLGGFKVGVGFSLRKCRDCMATLDTMSTKVCYQECGVEVFDFAVYEFSLHNLPKCC